MALATGPNEEELQYDVLWLLASCNMVYSDCWQIVTWYWQFVVATDQLQHATCNLLWLLTNWSVIQLLTDSSSKWTLCVSVCNTDRLAFQIHQHWWCGEESVFWGRETEVEVWERNHLPEPRRSRSHVNRHYFWMWQHGMHCQPSLLLNVTTPQYALSPVITFECDHNMVRTLILYYFWMWPQHGTHCQPLLLLNVTTARYTPSSIITFQCDHNTVHTVTCYYFWIWPQHCTHCQPLLLLNVTTAHCTPSSITTFECDHNTVHTVIHYCFWMWPQHRIRCHLLLLLNVTTARYTPSSFITVECDHSTVHTVILYYCRMRPHHGMHCIVVTLLPLYLTTELRIIIILNEFCVEVMSVYM